MFEPDRWYLTDEVADALGYKKKTLESWRYHKTGPRFLRATAAGVRYLGSDLNEWLESRFVQTHQ